MKLSLSMIVKNEEKFLPGCLESVKGLVDEIVIVDTGSTDNTKRIAESYGARIFDFEWCDDFSAARNESIRKATGDWILYLDADERIDKSFHDTIRKLIADRKVDAYLLNVKSRIGTEAESLHHLISYPRLFRNINGIAFVGQVHEQITTSLRALRARIVQSNVVIEHLGYAQSKEVIREKARRNYELLLVQVEKGENRGYALYQLGQTEIILGDIEKGLIHLNEALATGGFGNSVTASIYAIIAEKKLQMGEYEGALDACNKSIEFAQQQIFAYMLKADIYVKLREYRKAEESLLQAVRQYELNVSKGKVGTAIEPVFDVHVLYLKLGKTASLAEDIETAKAYFTKAIAEKPNRESVAAYLEFLLKNGMYHDAIEVAKQCAEFESEDWYLRLLSSVFIDVGDYESATAALGRIAVQDKVSLSSLANCELKLGDFAGAEIAFRRAIELGYDDPQGLELYGLALFRLGKFSEAVEILCKVLEMDQNNKRAEKFARAAKAQLSAATR
jgi:tetratricopeptide (TPR) repeat protein